MLLPCLPPRRFGAEPAANPIDVTATPIPSQPAAAAAPSVGETPTPAGPPSTTPQANAMPAAPAEAPREASGASAPKAGSGGGYSSTDWQTDGEKARTVDRTVYQASPWREQMEDEAKAKASAIPPAQEGPPMLQGRPPALATAPPPRAVVAATRPAYSRRVVSRTPTASPPPQLQKTAADSRQGKPSSNVGHSQRRNPAPRRQPPGEGMTGRGQKFCPACFCANTHTFSREVVQPPWNILQHSPQVWHSLCVVLEGSVEFRHYLPNATVWKTSLIFPRPNNADNKEGKYCTS